MVRSPPLTLMVTDASTVELGEQTDAFVFTVAFQRLPSFTKETGPLEETIEKLLLTAL